MYDIVFSVYYYGMHGTTVVGATGEGSALFQVKESEHILDSEHLQLDTVNTQNIFLTLVNILQYLVLF